jgi:Secretion system C-terminal sorting domain
MALIFKFFWGTSILLCLSSDYLQAQAPWAQNNSVWHFGGSLFVGTDKYERYHVEKDTLINGRNAKKIVGIHVEFDTVNLTPLYTYQDGDKVYYVHNQLGKFVLLYDFGAELDDTLKFYNPFFETSKKDSFFRVKVTGIKHHKYENKLGVKDTIKALYFARVDTGKIEPYYTYSFYWERFGTYPRFMPIRSPRNIFVNNWLCYHDSTFDIQIYRSFNCLNEDLFVGLETVSKGGFEIYPSPSNGNKINILFDKGSSFPSRIKIFDSHGKLLYSTNKVVSSGDQSIKLFLDDWESGIYSMVCYFESSGQYLTKKFFVLR